jgi:hypothetical protein
MMKYTLVQLLLINILMAILVAILYPSVCGTPVNLILAKQELDLGKPPPLNSLMHHHKRDNRALRSPR